MQTAASELDTPESKALTAAHAGRQRTRTVAGVVLTRACFDTWTARGWTFRADGGDWWAFPPEHRNDGTGLLGTLKAAVRHALAQDAVRAPETQDEKARRFRLQAECAKAIGNLALADVLNDQAERIEDQLLAAALDSPATTPASAPDLPRPTGDTPQPDPLRPAAVAVTAAGAPALGAGRCPMSLLAPFIRRTR